MPKLFSYAWLALPFTVFMQNGCSGAPVNSENAQNVHYSCTAEPAVDAAAASILCDALGERLGSQLLHGTTVLKTQLAPADGVHLFAHVEVATRQALKARLNWTTCAAGNCEPNETGPLVETFVMDANVTNATYGVLARSMLTLAKSPQNPAINGAIQLPWNE